MVFATEALLADYGKSISDMNFVIQVFPTPLLHFFARDLDYLIH